MKRKTRTIRNIVLVAAGVATGLLMGAERPVGKETTPAIPKTATIIPAPREIGWDQIFIESANRDAGGSKITSMLPKTTMGMCYRTHGAGASAANQGFDIVMTPHTYTYFDYRQGLAEDPYQYFGGMLPFARVYQFDPFAGVEESARPHVVGGQCCNWTSHTLNRFDLEWKLWPRGFALAEVLWTYPDPAKRDFAEFSARAAEYRRRLIGAHVNCAPLK